jgi:hypothetical protein
VSQSITEVIEAAVVLALLQALFRLVCGPGRLRAACCALRTACCALLIRDMLETAMVIVDLQALMEDAAVLRAACCVPRP